MKYLFFIIFFFVYLALNIIENFQREKWKYESNYRIWSKRWHSTQWFRWAFVFITINFVLFNFKGFIILIPFSIIWWILFDGFLNILRKRDFWFVSPYKNLSNLEKFASKRNKIILLIISIALTLWLMLYS